MNYDVVVIGGGAAGLMSSMLIAKKGHRVLLLEANKVVGRKIMISGGGKCNFTNLDVSFKNYQSQNIHFSKSALSRYSPWDFIDYLYKHNVEYFEKKDGQLFCKRSAQDIIKILLKECETSKVEIKTSCPVSDILHDENGYSLLVKDEKIISKNIIVATGGLSIPTIGANDFGLRMAKKFGHKLVETRPGLVPFTLNDNILPDHSDLSGVSLDVKIESDRKVFEDALLFTHKGLSGPSVLQASLYWRPGEKIKINFLPKVNVLELLLKEKTRGGKKTVQTVLKKYLPEKFTRKWCEIFLEDEKKFLSGTSHFELEKIADSINRWTFIPSGTEGYRKAEVTVGGVCTKSISSKTMMSSSNEGLYFVGEVLDVTGQLGGFNFQWAWASAHAASSNF